MGGGPVSKGEIVQSRTRHARIGLLAAATALAALILAAPAGAAQFSGGTIKVDLKQLTQKGVKASFPQGGNSKTVGTFTLGAGTATLNAQSSGSLATEGGQIKLKVGSKTVTLSPLTEKLAAGKGQLTQKAGGKVKRTPSLDRANPGKVGGNAGNTGPHMKKPTMQ